MRPFALQTIDSMKNDGTPAAQQQACIREIIEEIHARRPQIPREPSDRDIERLYDTLADHKASYTKGTSANVIAEQLGQHDEVLFFDTGTTPSLKLQIGKKDTVQENRRVAESELSSVLPRGSYLNDPRKRLIEKTLTGGRSVKNWLAREVDIGEEKQEDRESVLNASRDVTDTVRSGGSAEDVNFASSRPVKILKKALPAKFVQCSQERTPVVGYEVFSAQAQTGRVEAGRSGTIQPDSRPAGKGKARRQISVINQIKDAENIRRRSVSVRAASRRDFDRLA